MNARIVTRITITASRTEVFRYLSELHYHHLWNPSLQKITPLTTLQLGTKYDTMSLLLGKEVTAHNSVTALEPERLVQIENTTGPLHYTVQYRVTSRSKRLTQVTCTVVVSADSRAFAFATPILKLLAQRELRTDMEALKIAVEQKLE